MESPPSSLDIPPVQRMFPQYRPPPPPRPSAARGMSQWLKLLSQSPRNVGLISLHLQCWLSDFQGYVQPAFAYPPASHSYATVRQFKKDALISKKALLVLTLACVCSIGKINVASPYLTITLLVFCYAEVHNLSNSRCSLSCEGIYSDNLLELQDLNFWCRVSAWANSGIKAAD